MEREPNRRQWGAWLVIGVAVFVLLASIYPLAVPVNEDDFADATGVDWAEFSTAEPEAAQYLEREARLLGAIAVGFGLLVLALAAGPLRRGEVPAWKVMWVLPLSLGLIAAVFLSADGGFLGGVYLVLLILAGLGLWLVRPEPARAAGEVA
jgi:hypothetical protein